MTIEQMIERVELSVSVRQIGIAEFLAYEFSNEHSTSPLKESGYAVLSIMMSYFEMIEQFRTGKDSEGHSKDFFVAGFRAVYPCTTLSDDDIKDLYKWVRCGMFHSGVTKFDTHLVCSPKTGPGAMRVS
jgi:hypothetical protein